jgi:hypothetical protein
MELAEVTEVIEAGLLSRDRRMTTAFVTSVWDWEAAQADHISICALRKPSNPGSKNFEE